MCGRFSFNLPPELLAKIFALSEHPAIPPGYNIAPTQLARYSPAIPVSPLVNKVGNDSTDLVVPVGDTSLLDLG